MANMKIETHMAIDTEAGTDAIDRASDGYGKALLEWFDRHGKKITKNHYLMASNVRLQWSKEKTEYHRSADLMLKAEASNTSQDKCVLKDAVSFTAGWPNPEE